VSGDLGSLLGLGRELFRSVRGDPGRRLGCGVWRLVGLVLSTTEGVDGTKTSDPSQIAVKLFHLGRKSLGDGFTEGN
jgi:hypothetical protein